MTGFDHEHFLNLWTEAVRETHRASVGIHAAHLKDGYRAHSLEHLRELVQPTVDAFSRVDDYLRGQ